jgi:hypothetical protein
MNVCVWIWINSHSWSPLLSTNESINSLSIESIESINSPLTLTDRLKSLVGKSLVVQQVAVCGKDDPSAASGSVW